MATQCSMPAPMWTQAVPIGLMPYFARSMNEYRGIRMRASWPSRRSALGRPATTSPRPPVLA